MRLNLTAALHHPLITDRFQVVIRENEVNAYGEVIMDPINAASPCLQDVIGVVCAATPNDLKRWPELQMMDRAISIVTQFRLQGPSDGMSPSLVKWRGDYFIVKAVDVYSHVGSGFIQAIAVSQDYVDQQPL